MVSKVTIRAELVDEVSTGLRRIDRGFERTFQRVGQLANRFLSVAGRIGGVAAGLSAAVVSRQALELAERQVQAERRLLAATGDRRDLLDEIRGIASDLQAGTTFGDEEVLDIASGLLSAGVAAGDLEKALKATLDTSVALGVSTDQVAQAISSFQINQTGLLARRAPFLKQLQEDGLLAAEGIDALLERFGGSAGSLADTPFGQAEQQSNRLGDALERLGEVLIRIKVAAFDPLIEAAESAAQRLGSPEFQGFVSFLAQGAPIAVRFAGGVGLLAAGLVAIASSGAALQLAGVVTAAIAGREALGALADRTSRLSSAFPRLGSRVDDALDGTSGVVQSINLELREMLSLLAQGQIGASDIIDLGSARISALFDLTAELLLGSGSIDGAIEEYVNRITDASEKIQDSARTARNAQARATRNLISDEQDRVETLIRGLDELREEIDGISGLTQESIRIDLEQLVDTDQLDEVLSSVPAAASGDLRELLLERLQGAFEEQQVTIEDFFRVRRFLRLEVDPAQEADEALQAIGERETAILADIAEAEERIRVASRIERENREFSGSEVALAATQQLQQETEKQRGLVQSLVEVEQARRDVLEDLAQAQVRLAAESDAVAREELDNVRSVFEGAVEAREALDDQLQSIAAQREGGLLEASEAFAQERQSLADFELAVSSVRSELEALAEASPDLAEQLEVLLARLDNLSEGVNLQGTASQFEQLRTGFVEGAGQMINRFADLSRAGRQFGETVIGGLGQALGAFFTSTDRDFRRLVGSILQQLAQLAIQVAFFRAIAGLAPAPIADIPATSAPLGGIFNRGGIAGVQAFNSGGFAERSFRAVGGLAKRTVAAASLVVAPIAAPVAAQPQQPTEPPQAGPYHPQTHEDGRQETGKELAKRIGRELAAKEKPAKPEVRFPVVEEDPGLDAAADSRDTVAVQAERTMGTVGQTAERITSAVGKAGIRTMLILGAMGLIDPAGDIQAEEHNVGGMAGSKVPPLIEANAGFVPGQRGPNRDSVLAFLTVGEGIIQRPSVDYYGKTAIKAINDRVIPREALEPYLRGLPNIADRIEGAFNTGGFTSAPSSAASTRPSSQRGGQGGSTVLPVVVANEDGLDRLLAGGDEAFVRAAERKREALRGVLGITQGF